jgi:pimeloyl-ACP methyl ester carboxylesterase
MAQDVEKQTGSFSSFDGTRIYYEVRGSGRPIFLCYGLACLINHWNHQIKHFSGSYQTIAFDYRGHHASGAPDDPSQINLDALCKDLSALADHLGIPRASFWGHSYGVQILLRMYELYPEKIDNLVLINGFAKNPINGMFGIDALPKLFETFFELFKESHRNFPDLVSAFWKSAVTSPFAIPLSALAGGFNLNLTRIKDIEVYAKGVGSMDLNSFISLFEQMMDYNAEHVLCTIDRPTLIVSGLRDGVTPPKYQTQMHEQIRNSQLFRVPYGSHCTQLDWPEIVNLRIEKFLVDCGYGPNLTSPTRPATRPRARRKSVSNDVE